MSCNHLADCQRCGNKFEKLATDRDEWEQLAYRYQDERDALAAHVERLPALLDKLTHNLIQMRACKRQDQIRGAIEVFETDIDEIRQETPTTSLARLKAEWQAEVLDDLARWILATCQCADPLDIERFRHERLQAEENKQ